MGRSKQLTADQSVMVLLREYNRIQAPVGKYALLRAITTFVIEYEVSQDLYDLVFTMALKERGFIHVAHNIFDRVSPYLVARYRMMLMTQGKWTLLFDVVSTVGPPLSSCEIDALSKVISDVPDTRERQTFREFIDAHPKLSLEQKFVIGCRVPCTSC